MDADQPNETTLSPATRHLRRLTVEEAEDALAACETCMSNDVGPRRDFIVEHGGLLDEHLIDA